MSTQKGCLDYERGTYVGVLDHGYVKFVDWMGNDESIVEAARMSTGKGFISWDPYVRCEICGAVGHMNVAIEHGIDCEGDPRLLSKFPRGDLGLLDTLWRKKHATPFEMGELLIEVQLPLMVAREWHRHRTFSYNEFSARYAVMPDLHYVPDEGRVGRQSVTNKQGTSSEKFDKGYVERFLADIERQQEELYESYETWVEDGMAKEIARLNTPVSRYTKFRAKGNVRNWLQLLNLRHRPTAQKEFQLYAEQIGIFLRKIWPRTFDLFEEYDLYGAHLSRTELKVLRQALGTDGIAKVVSLASESLAGAKLSEFTEKLEYGGIKIL